MNELLSIVIPCFDSLGSLKKNLEGILHDLQKYSIAVYITDDSSNNNIKNFVNEYSKYHEYISYVKNSPRLGHDKNFVMALKQSKTAYTWIIGDRVGIHKTSIKKVLKIISKNQYDIISVNKEGRNINISSKHYSNPTEIFNIFGWHLTYTGATIYSNRAIENIGEISLDNFRNFPQIGLIFTYLSYNCSFFWLNEQLLYSISKKDSYWVNNAIDVFIKDWEFSVYNLPNIYNEAVKKSTIIKHSKNSNLFNTKFLLKMRMNNNYNSIILKKYKNQLIEHSGKNHLLLYFISIAPRWVLSFFKSLRKILSSNFD